MKINDSRTRTKQVQCGWETTTTLDGNVESRYVTNRYVTNTERVDSYRGKKSLVEVEVAHRTREGKDVRLTLYPPNEFLLIKSIIEPGSSFIVFRDEPTPTWPHNRVTTITNGVYEQFRDDLKLYYGIEPWERTGFTAINQAYAKANSPNINGMTQVVEFMESLTMLAQIAAGIRAFAERSLIAYRNKRRLAVRDLSTSDLSDFWLQYRYGFLPLYLQANEVLSYLTSPAHEEQYFTGSAHFEETKRFLIGPKAGIADVVFTGSAVASVKRRANACVVLRYKRDANPLGFGGYDAILAGWEKVPFSFVVDWFIGVGDWLAAYRPGGIDVLWSYCTIVQEVETKIQSVHVNKPSWAHTKTSMDIGKPISRKETRVDRITPVVPSTLPAWQVASLSWQRQVDAIALTHQMLTGQVVELFYGNSKPKTKWRSK